MVMGEDTDVDIADELTRRLMDLTPEDRLRVLEYARSLPDAPRGPRTDSRGMFAHHLTVPITKEMIDEARREMWANFPRDFPEGRDEP
jgi:hypothetical protein